MDSSVQPLVEPPHFSLVSTCDFFYPLVEDPFLMGAIACANVLSDLYAMGCSRVDTVLMILAASSDMKEPLRSKVTRLFIKGFEGHCRLAGSRLSGGQTVQNPWPIVGGTAMSVMSNDQVLVPRHAQVDDVLVLTKPLGIQIAVNVKQWSHAPEGEKWLKLMQHAPIDEKDMLYLYHRAQSSMLRLNRTSASLLLKHNAHACTDVTGFGILGHSCNLASLQLAEVDFVIDVLPCIAGSMRISDALSMRLRLGTAAETSGGLLIAMTLTDAQNYIQEIQQLDNEPAWIIGRVTTGHRQAHIAQPVAELSV